MLPIGDDNSDRTRFPFMNYILIGINILVFIFLQQASADSDFTYAYVAVPGEILSGQDIVREPIVQRDPVTGDSFVMRLDYTPVHVWLTLFTSMFMHGGWAHLGGNMLYLWVFGDNIENRLGHLKYLFFYLLCGVIASLTHVFTTYFLGDNLLIPSLGASGAISGILGAYLLLFPRRSVHIFLFFTIISVPALVALGLWIVLQILNGTRALGGNEVAGVAYSAHIGGFIAGMVLIKFFDRAPKVAVQRQRRFF